MAKTIGIVKIDNPQEGEPKLSDFVGITLHQDNFQMDFCIRKEDGLHLVKSIQMSPVQLIKLPASLQEMKTEYEQKYGTISRS